MSRFFVTMPQLGESVAEGTISRWLVRPGEAIDELDAMVEINTDKVDAEVPAPVTGVVAEILAPEGAVVPIGGNIAVIEVTETQHSDAVATAEHRALEGDEDVSLTPVRRRIADTMSLSKTTIPHAWQAQEVDMSGVAKSIAANRGAVRRQHNGSLTYLPYVVAAVAASLRSHPIVNSTFADDRIVIHHEINIGIAIGLREGVVVPVIRGADRISVAGLAAAVTDLTTRARNGKFTTDDLAGATLTVNNSGALGTLLSYSVIPPGQSAIVTMGAVVDRPVAVDGQPVVRPMMYLCLSLDHRVMDGLEASAFLGACRQWLEAVSVSTVL